MKKGIIRSITIVLIFTWVFSGWPRFWNFPSEVKRVEAVTTLTSYLTSSAATTIATANLLSDSAPASETNNVTKIGKTTGYCELYAQGSGGGGCTGSTSIPAPSGNGFLWDVTTLEAQQILSGNWTGAMKLAINKTGVTATGYMRAFKYSSDGTYTPIATSSAASKALGTTAAALTFSAGAGALTNFNVGDKLYIDFLVNITSNSANSNTETVSLYMNGGAAERMITPGYQPLPPTVTTNSASQVTISSATLNGNIDVTAANATTRGFAWGTNSNLSGGDTATTSEAGSFGVGAFTTDVSSLTSGTTYYFRSYATNSAGTGYGAVQNFTTGSSIVSVIVSSNGTVSYGALLAGTSSSTAPAYTQTLQNDGTGSETFNIKGQDTACPWILSSAAGTDQYVHDFSTNSGSSWTHLTTAYQTLATGVASNGTVNLDLRITVPSSTSCYSAQSVDVTIQAVSG
jgi:hypothetical protein